jgi:two-component system, OmpR family, sensor histidine kinase ChvG
VVTAYEMDADWRYATSGTPSNPVQGFMEETERGFRLEFRMPLSLLGSSRYFGLAFVDVDDPVTRAIRRTTQTLPTAGKESFNLVVLRSPEVLNIIQGLGYSGARILVIDPQKRVRAETGSNVTPPPAEESTRRCVSSSRAGSREMRPWVHRLITGEPWEPRRSSWRTPQSTAEAVINSSLPVIRWRCGAACPRSRK